MKADDLRWWQKEIIYQVYPRSFMDANNDGVGDLPGILSKLDYLHWLGVKAVWISPIYPSPMADFGYDISDYTAIDPVFGTMDDFHLLLEAAHGKGMKIIMDLVPNHTSEEHPWFRESRSSRDNPKRDWYIWKDPAKDGGQPNNWISEFGGSAWEYDHSTRQYYCHSFLKEQPDLNWHNPAVREAIWDVMRYWLEKGVDGFRVDVMWYMIKDKLFRDNPPNPEWHEGMPEHDKLIPAFSNDQPEVHEVVAEMRKVLDEFPDRLLIGEIYLPVNKLVAYYGKNGGGAHLPYNFQLISTPWEAAEINTVVSAYEGALPEGGWPNWAFGNHDKPRIRARTGKEQVRNAALLLLTLRGTPTLYYGDEIGMDDVNIPREKIHDPRELIEPGIGVGRDPQRTPMQWTGGKYAGFSATEPWLPVGMDLNEANVEKQKEDADSLLSFYQRLIRLRQSEPALYMGDYLPLGVQEDVLAYTRKYADTEFLVCMNMGDKQVLFAPDKGWKGKIEIATTIELEGSIVSNKISLHGGEGALIRLNAR